MSFASLRRYDVQATYALVLAIVGVGPFLAALYLVGSHYDALLGQIIYGAKGRFVPAFAGCILLSIVPSTLAFILGWSRSGQRRNEKSSRSWTGFFLGGGIATFDLILLIAFYMLRFEMAA